MYIQLQYTVNYISISFHYQGWLDQETRYDKVKAKISSDLFSFFPPDIKRNQMISNSERRTTFYQLRLHTSTGSLGQNWTIRLQETRNKAFYKFLVPIACFGPKHLTGPTELDWNHCSLPLLRLVNFGYVTATTIAEPLRLTANWTKIRAIAVNIFLFFLKNNPSFNISESGQIHPLDISITSITLSIKPSIIVNLLHFWSGALERRAKASTVYCPRWNSWKHWWKGKMWRCFHRYFHSFLTCLHQHEQWIVLKTMRH